MNYIYLYYILLLDYSGSMRFQGCVYLFVRTATYLFSRLRIDPVFRTGSSCCFSFCCRYNGWFAGGEQCMGATESIEICNYVQRRLTISPTIFDQGLVIFNVRSQRLIYMYVYFLLPSNWILVMDVIYNWYLFYNTWSAIVWVYE